jgi:hypothetical protein
MQKIYQNIGAAKYIEKQWHIQNLWQMVKTWRIQNLWWMVKTWRLEKYWCLHKCWPTGKTRRPSMLAQQEK